MLNDEVYGNNTCSENDLKRGIQSADPTISPGEPSLFFKYEKSRWSDQWHGPNKLRILYSVAETYKAVCENVNLDTKN